MEQEVETLEDIKAVFREIALRFEETDRRFAETDRALRRVERMVSDLTGKWGKFVEGLVAPGAVRMFQERGIDVRISSQRVRASKDGEEMEIDVLVEDDEYVVLIEVKSTLGVEDVKEHLERLGKFKEFFPRYKDMKVLGAVAGIVIEEGADRYAYRNGLFVIGQSGESVRILNDERFKPRIW
jgi:hypothetical protein